MPLTLADLLATHQPNPLPVPLIRTIFTALFRALAHLHAHGIIHRDIKPTAILLTTPSPHHPHQIHLADFGTAYHPTLSPPTGEPPTQKVLDIGTGPDRAPETLFGDRAYGPGVDLWAAGTTLAECLLGGHRTLFESRAAHEDGNQLGLVLSMFKTLGTPTAATWPEARGFRTPPFEMYRVFEGRVEREGWDGVLGGEGGGEREGWRGLVAGLVRYESGWRVTAEEVSGSLFSGLGDGDANLCLTGVGVSLYERGGGWGGCG
jgi:serine/threonine protein kinase